MNYPKYSVIPLKAGLRYFLAENFYKSSGLGARYEGWSGDRKDNSLIVPVKSFVGLRLAFNFGI